MKILLFTPEYPPYHIGGGGIVYQNLAEALLRKGIDVVVIWGFYPTKSIKASIKKYKEKSITFYQIPEIPYLKKMPYLRTAMPPNMKGIISLPHILKKERPDVIHFHGYGLPFIGYGMFLSVVLNIPFLLTIHGFPKSPEKNVFFRLFWMVYQRLIMNHLLQKVKKITCISHWLKKDKRLKAYQRKISIIYNGIDIEKYQKIERSLDNQIFQRKNLVPDGARFIVSVGRISEMKGFHLVINILPQLLKEYANLYYVIIGDDDGYKDDLIALSKALGVEKNIIFTGFIEEELKFNYVKESDAYIVPSLWEPFGLTALEGLALKKVVLTTGAGGLQEFLKKSSNVMFFNQNDDESLYQAITSVLDKKTIYLEDNHLHQFTWTVIVDKYIDEYYNVIGGK